jgi:hypothetical protein
VQDFAQGMLDALLSKIEAGGTAEKIAENDYLMKCLSLHNLPSHRIESRHSRDARDRYGSHSSHAEV